MGVRSDAELVAAAGAGDEAAWALLWQRHHRWIRSYATDLLGDSFAAEDVASEVLTSAVAGAGERPPPDNLGAYLRVATRNRVVDVVRGRQRDARLARSLRALAPESYDDPPPRDDAIAAPAIGRALAALSERQRRVLVRIGIEEAPVAEVAAELGLTPNAVHQLVFRARRRLREELAVQTGP